MRHCVGANTCAHTVLRAAVRRNRSDLSHRVRAVTAGNSGVGAQVGLTNCRGLSTGGGPTLRGGTPAQGLHSFLALLKLA